VAIGRVVVEAEGQQDIEIIDAEGKLLIPGLVSAHYHSHDTLLRGMFEQLPLDAWMLYSAPGQLPRYSSEMIETRTALGAVECLSNGITTIQDMVSIVNNDREHLDRILQTYEQVRIRTVLALQLSAVRHATAYPSGNPCQTQLPASFPERLIRTGSCAFCRKRFKKKAHRWSVGVWDLPRRNDARNPC
jgi:cytosine/adenosine deaminase-related metal-dependent hydrolase